VTKYAVYTITKNEANHIARWAESAKDADYRVVVDTGSTDETVEIARDAGCTVHVVNISPWRFDDARNTSLALVPYDADLCIALDADEVLAPEWRMHLDGLNPYVTRPRYKYVWSWNEDGTQGLTYSGDKIHTRVGYRWKHPVHEVITPTGEEVQDWCGLEIYHHPDSTKPRQYIHLLELSVSEEPTDDRNAHYLAREYLYHGRIPEAAAEFKRHLALPKAVWAPERAKSMRLLAQCEPDQEEAWLLKAAAEYPHSRETWIALSQYHHRRENWPQCFAYATRALSINDRDLTYINEAEAWGAVPWDLAAISAYELHLYDQALEYGTEAARLAPEDPRIVGNVQWYFDRTQRESRVSMVS